MKRFSTFAALLLLPVSGLCQQSIVASPSEEAELKKLISQLIFADQKATGEIIFSPGAEAEKPEYRKREKACQEAYKKLFAFKAKAVPFLVEHLDNDRQSLAFRNH